LYRQSLLLLLLLLLLLYNSLLCDSVTPHTSLPVLTRRAIIVRVQSSAQVSLYKRCCFIYIYFFIIFIVSREKKIYRRNVFVFAPADLVKYLSTRCRRRISAMPHTTV